MSELASGVGGDRRVSAAQIAVGALGAAAYLVDDQG